MLKIKILFRVFWDKCDEFCAKIGHIGIRRPYLHFLNKNSVSCLKFNSEQKMSLECEKS